VGKADLALIAGDIDLVAPSNKARGRERVFDASKMHVPRTQ
jgi:hypothetical protein